jgi:hypothetical protein
VTTLYFASSTSLPGASSLLSTCLKLFSGSNCGVGNPIRILDRDPTEPEVEEGCILVRKQVALSPGKYKFMF